MHRINFCGTSVGFSIHSNNFHMFDLFAPMFSGFVPCECDSGLYYIIITGIPPYL